MAFDISTAKPVDQQQPTSGGFDINTAQPAQEQQQEPGFFQENIAPLVAPFSEFAAAANRGALQFAESLTIDPLNASAQLLGIEGRIPKPSETELVQKVTGGGFLEPGLVKDVISTAGELVGPGGVIGGITRGAARNIAVNAPALTTAPIQTGVRGALQTAKEVVPGVAAQISRGGARPAALDVGLTAASGVGAEVGREVGGETGALIGSFLAPISATGVAQSGKSIFSAGKRGVDAISGSIAGMSDDGAAKLLAEAMVGEGIGPDEVVKRLAALGPEALPADVGAGFAGLLRRAANEIPRIRGQAGQILTARTKGQGPRVATAFDDATGTASLTVDDEIVRLNKVLGPDIDRAYTAARARSDKLPSGKAKNISFAGEEVGEKTKLGLLLSGKGVAGSKVKAKADLEITAKTLSGEEVTSLDVIDATKRALDDEIQTAIRKGSNNKSRSLVILKNTLLKEADKAIPEYAEARNLFAGKASLENAADQGSLFLKMKVRDIESLTQSLGESEKRFFKLGAKQAIMDKIETIQTKADLTRIFGTGGSAKKLEFLFDDKESFKRFSDTLETEAKFIMTRNAAQGNSTSAQQIVDITRTGEGAEKVLELATPVGAARFFGKVVGGLSQQRGTDAHTQALEDVGDILLQKGFDVGNLTRLLRRGSSKEIESRFRRAIRSELQAKRITPITTGVGAEILEDPQRNQQ